MPRWRTVEAYHQKARHANHGGRHRPRVETVEHGQRARADLDRMVHQRQFMSAVLHRASSPAVWLNPWRWYAIPHAVIGALTVDSGAHVWDLARLGWALAGSTTTVTVPIAEFTGSDSGSVVVWDSAGATALFDALRSDSAIPQEVLDAQP